MNNQREQFVDLNKCNEQTKNVINSFIIGGFVKDASPEDIRLAKSFQNAYKDVIRPLMSLEESKLRKEFSKYFGIVYYTKCNYDLIKRVCKNYDIDYNKFMNQCIDTFDKYNWLDLLMDVFIEAFGENEMLDDELQVYDNIVLLYEFKQLEQKAFENITSKIK